jgi:hypothetical protein
MNDTQAPAGEQIAFDRTALNPTEAAKMAAWQQESGIEVAAEEPVEQALPSAQAHEFDLGDLRGDGLPYTEADKAADSAIRGWLADADLPKGTGTFIASEARKLVPQLQAMTDAQRDLFQQQERVKLERIWGDGYNTNLTAARSLVQEIEAKRPGIVDFLERSGLGDSSVVIGLLASHGSTRARKF